MKSKVDIVILLYAFIVVLQQMGIVRGQEDEYEYYYEDEITSTVVPTTTTTTTTTTTMRTTTAGKKKPTRKVPGSSQTIVAGPGKNGKQQACSARTCVGYQYGRPDVVFNVIADMYDLQAMLPNNRRNGGMSYVPQNKELPARFEQPFAYWYGPRQISKPIRRQQPTLIDYGIIRRPGIAQESLYGYDDGGELYTDYYDYYEYADYDYPAKNKQDAKTKDSNRLFVNFILNALGPRRPN
ncbi:uncharacterized protein LOC119769622 [Culex quinquefasciatus]|uniref:uncharacterized protein LOC119769622 n=1 Tax=Culex quinquefasciatus TaxID=7176 RepID=UPI0018E39365|nr:uncharacterized protein LOC119769622 [Culex quinquefasciatus]XP_039436530.1 uncharacterized protein LOC120418276 isoform X2 [Culex pipiens pallens]